MNRFRNYALLAASATALISLSAPATAATTIEGATDANGIFTYQFSFAGGPLEIHANSSGINPIRDPYLYLFADNGSPLNGLTGALIGRNDDAFGSLNAFLGYPNLAGGNYIARVGKWPLNDENAVRRGMDNAGVCPGCTLTLAFNQTVSQPTGAVPEPSTWALMLLGFFGLGAAVRRQNRQSVTVSYA